MGRVSRLGFVPPKILLSLWLALPAIAQNCRIVGHITDSRHAVVPNAIVTVTQLDTGLARQVLANAQGEFQLVRMPPGDYRVGALKPGFKPLKRKASALCSASASLLDLQLEESPVSEVVTLEARKAGDGSLLMYICGLARGSGCELLEPSNPASTLDVATLSAVVP